MLYRTKLDRDRQDIIICAKNALTAPANATAQETARPRGPRPAEKIVLALVFTISAFKIKMKGMYKASVQYGQGGGRQDTQERC